MADECVNWHNHLRNKSLSISTEPQHMNISDLAILLLAKYLIKVSRKVLGKIMKHFQACTHTQLLCFCVAHPVSNFVFELFYNSAGGRKLTVQ